MLTWNQNGHWYRWSTSTTTLKTSETPCFDPALEATARVVEADWIDVNGHTVPVFKANGHDESAILAAVASAHKEAI